MIVPFTCPLEREGGECECRSISAHLQANPTTQKDYDAICAVLRLSFADLVEQAKRKAGEKP